MKESASQIKVIIENQLENDHLPYIVGHDYSDDSGYDSDYDSEDDHHLTPEELAIIKDFDEEFNKRQEKHVKFGAYTIFIIQGDLNKIKNEIIVPLQISLKESDRKKLDLEFREMSIEELISSYDTIGTPQKSNGGVLVIEGVERLDYSKDYVHMFARLTTSPIQTSENGNLARWSLLLVSKECEDEKFLFNSTWNYYRNKGMLVNLTLE